MILVAGTTRSGTSMWMQILEAAGLPLLGERFPEVLTGMESANPGGFFETRLRDGINPYTNPDPTTGRYLFPEPTRGLVIKVFAIAVPRTEIAFIDHVVGTVRPWREWCSSHRRLRALEAHVRQTDSERRLDHLPIRWWAAVYSLIRDASIRRYPLHLVTFDRVIRDPEAEIAAVLRFLGTGTLSPAVAVVDPTLQHDQDPLHPDDSASARGFETLFDEVYDAIDQGHLDSALLERMNRAHRRIQATFAAG